MGHTIVLIGPTASGKTSLAEYMSFFGWRRTVTCTTRPPRPGERDGIDYWFVSDKQFKSMIKENILAEYTEYTNEKDGHYFYGSTKSSYNDKHNHILVLDPIGVIALTEPAYIVWLDLPKKILTQRLRKRGDPLKNVLARIKNDSEKFKSFEETKKYDMRIIDELSLYDLAFIINKFAKEKFSQSKHGL